jgi:hypothetical protein
MHSSDQDFGGLSAANSTELSLDSSDNSTDQLPFEEKPTLRLPQDPSDNMDSELPLKEPPTSRLSQDSSDNSAYGFPIVKAPHTCQGVSENGGSLPSKVPASSIPNGGFNAWLQVAGSFMLFYNSW